jgi:type IV pilus biogenesis protein CpaD/CtpE
MRPFLLPILAAATVAALATTARADGDYRCAAMVDSALAKIGIAKDRVENIVVAADVAGTKEGVLVGYVAWVAVKGRRGTVNVEMGTLCNLRQVYTLGGAAIAGVPGY